MNRETQSWLEALLAARGAFAGTVHRREGEGLRLEAAVNIPPAVAQVVAWVPNGKGMAGLAMQRDRPVQTCNLQTDETGDIRPGARAVEAQAAVAMPVHDAEGAVRAVVGVAFREDRALGEEEIRALMQAAASLP